MAEEKKVMADNGQRATTRQIAEADPAGLGTAAGIGRHDDNCVSKVH